MKECGYFNSSGCKQKVVYECKPDAANADLRTHINFWEKGQEKIYRCAIHSHACCKPWDEFSELVALVVGYEKKQGEM